MKERNVFQRQVAKFCENFSRKRKFRFLLLSDTYIIITSMPMFAMYRVKVERIIWFVKIVNQTILKEKKVLRRHHFRSFDGGSVTIKGVKTLYLSVVHSKHTASYTG